MRPIRTACLLLVLGVLFWNPTASFAQGADKFAQDTASDLQAKVLKRQALAGSAACVPGEAFADLDVNNVRARLYNTGQLFRGSGGVLYEVPKGGGVQSIFASGIWIGGMAGDELRMAAATYAQGGEDYEFFPGPLGPDGAPPADCSQYDQLWEVTRQDIQQYELTGTATDALANWPVELGAPFVDADGDGEYNLEDGDRPEIIGDQTIWWVMNDAAGPHLTTTAPAIGLEVQVTAFAFNTADALNNTTFYRYKLIYKPQDDVTLTNVWLGLWSDPDLGNYTDDFVGSDTTLGLGFVYNGDPYDEISGPGYGNRPPALGYDFFQGPLVNDDGIDNDGDGVVDESDERLQMERFVYYNNVNGQPTGNPDGAQHYYRYLRGIWGDGTPMQRGGDGYDEGTEQVNYMFPAEPPNYWSEDNVDGRGTSNQPSDRRFLQTTGPFTLEPGDTQEIVFGIVWSQTADRIGSVKQLKADDIVAQGAFDFDFDIPPPPDAPCLGGQAIDDCLAGPDGEIPGGVAELDQQIVLSWGNPSTSNNYLNSYDRVSPFLTDPNVADTTYTFEGYKVYQYASPSVAPEDGELIATIDVVNGVTTITQEAIDPNTGAPIVRVVAQGTDSGVQNHLIIEQDYLTGSPLRNYTEYFYGIQAYAYNEFSQPRIRQSPVRRLEVVPSRIESAQGGTRLSAEAGGQVIEGEIDKLSDAIVQAEIVDPTAVTGAQYEVRFYNYQPQDTSASAFLTYNIVNAETGSAVVNGGNVFETTGRQLPLDDTGGSNVVTAQGLSFTIVDAPAGIAGGGSGIVETTWAGDPVANQNAYGGDVVWHGLNSTADYYVSASGSGDLSRLERYIVEAAPDDYELRFTEEGGYGVYAFANDMIATVPFEMWNTGAGTPDDPSDDVRMIPFLLSPVDDDPSSDSYRYGFGTEPYFGYPGSTILYFMDADVDAGGYEAFEDAAEAAGGAGATYPYDSDGSPQGYYADFGGGFVYPIGRFMIGDFAQDGTPPPSGTTIRIVTTKPINAGDVFTIDTEGLAPNSGLFAGTDTTGLTEELIEQIAVVPNPYRGASRYDVSATQDQVRFTNLPGRATIRVFSLSGALVRQLEKTNPDTRYLPWDLRTMDGLPIASGMYLVHIELKGENGEVFGEKVLKFAAVKKRIQLDVF